MRVIGRRLLALGLSWACTSSVYSLELSGRVEDDTGRPLALIEVAASRLACFDGPPSEKVRGRTDSDGRFRISGLGAGAWSLKVTPYAGLELVREVFPVVHDLRVPPLVLPAPSSGRGLMLRDDDGRPVRGVVAQLIREDYFGRTILAARSDDEGRIPAFSCDRLKVGQLSTEGFVAADPVDRGQSCQVTLSPAPSPETPEPKDELVSWMIRAEVEPDHSPIEDAVVWTEREGCAIWSRTDRQGRAILRSPARSDPSEVHVAAAGFERSTQQTPSAGGRKLTLRLQPTTATAEGVILDRDGTPIEDAITSWHAGERSAVSGREGRLIFHEIPFRKILPVTVEKRGFLPQRGRLAGREAIAGVAPQPRELILLRPWTVAGKVALPGGRAAAACEVLLGSDPEIHARCDSKGEFALSPIPDGYHVVLIRHDSGKNGLVNLELDRQAPNPLAVGPIVLGLGGEIRGWVFDAETEAPLEGAEIYADFRPGLASLSNVKRDPQYRPKLHRVATSTGDGSFTVSGLPLDQDLFLEAWHADHLPQDTHVRLHEDQIVGEVFLGLPAAAFLDLQLIEKFSRQPVAGVNLTVSQAGPQEIRFTGSTSMVTDEEGRVVVRTFPSAQIKIRVVHPDFSWEQQTLHVDDPGTNRAQLAIFKGTHLLGTLLDRFGAPVGEGRVRIVHGDISSIPWQDDLDEGRFDIAGLRPGENRLRYFAANGSLVEELIIHLEPGRHEMELRLRSAIEVPAER